MPPPILEAISVTKTYPRRGGMWREQAGTIRAVDQVSCALGPGETLGLVGESGCGKTTLAKLLVGYLQPTAGEVRMQGHPISSLRGRALLTARRLVQFIFQDPANSLNPRMSVEESIVEPLVIHTRLSRTTRRERVEALLETVQLPRTYRQRLPRELSGGERQRVGIARALATEPMALICDEPIAALDVLVGAHILDLLRRLAKERHMALCFISHDLRAVASLCERIAVMRHGCLLEIASTDSILHRPQHPYTALLLRAATLELDSTPTDPSA